MWVQVPSLSTSQHQLYVQTRRSAQVGTHCRDMPFPATGAAATCSENFLLEVRLSWRVSGTGSLVTKTASGSPTHMGFCSVHQSREVHSSCHMQYAPTAPQNMVFLCARALHNATEEDCTAGTLEGVFLVKRPSFFFLGDRPSLLAVVVPLGGSLKRRQFDAGRV